MKNQADERKILEAEIYDRTMKLENIVAENEHFKQVGIKFDFQVTF